MYLRKHTLFSVIIMATAFVFGHANGQTVEISERFQAVAQRLIREHFKDVVFNELKDNDPILAASTYDLIDRIVSNDSLPEIKKQVIVSIFDYLEFLHLRNYLKRSFPKKLITKKSKEMITDGEYDKLMSVSGLLMYKFLADSTLMVTSDGITKTILHYNKDLLAYDTLPHSLTAVEFDGSIADFMSANKEYILQTIQFNAALKNVIVSLSMDDSILKKLKSHYELITTKNFPSNDEFLAAVQDTVKQLLLALTNEVGQSYGKHYSDMFMIIAPYVNSMIFQKINQQPIDYSRQLLIALAQKLEEMYEQNKSRFKYKIGLWSGMFFSGTSWDPPGTSYPVLSFRINDRFQYTVCDCRSGEWFVYLGGFSDMFIKELSNKTNNRFGYAGAGVTMKAVTFAVSATVPVDKDAADIGFVISLMYDLPIEKLLE